MNEKHTNLIHKQRVVIGIQVGLLLFVLLGLFGQAWFDRTSPENEAVQFSDVAVANPAENKWEQLTKTEVRARAAHVYDVILISENVRCPPIASIKLMTASL